MMKNEPKFCKDCKWCEQPYSVKYSHCMHPKNTTPFNPFIDHEEEINGKYLTDGDSSHLSEKQEVIYVDLCKDLRQRDSWWIFGFGCGKKAKWFEPKEI